jgi:hypothetical protein
MEIHKPKPIHNWREFLKEVGTIVLGVCIALAAEQGVEWQHWRSQVQGARQALAQELARNMRNSAARVVMTSCVEDRLDKLADVLDGASRSGTLPPLSEALMYTPQMDWPTSTWKGVTSSDVVSHFPRNELNGLGLAYGQIEMLSRLNEQEITVSADLSAMIGPGRRLDPAMDASLHLALSRARLLNRMVAINGGQLVQRAMGLGLPYDDEDRHRMASRLSVVRGRGCTRHGEIATTIPPRYGQAAASEVLKALRDMQKLPPYTDAK